MQIKIKVKTGSKKQELRKISKMEYEADLKNRPEDYKANLELIKLLKKEFKKVKLINGFTSKNKILEVE